MLLLGLWKGVGVDAVNWVLRHYHYHYGWGYSANGGFRGLSGNLTRIRNGRLIRPVDQFRCLVVRYRWDRYRDCSAYNLRQLLY